MTTPTPEAGVPEPAQLAEVQATDALLERLSRRASRPGDLDDPVFAALSDLAVHVEEDEVESAAAVAHMLELLQLGAAPDVQGDEEAEPGTAAPEVTAAERPSRVIDLTEQSAAAEPVSEEPAAKDAAAEDAAAEDSPAEVTAADETAAEQAPAEQAAAEQAPAEEAPAEGTPTEETRAAESVAEDAPAKIAASAEPAPAQTDEPADEAIDEPVAQDASERSAAPPTIPIPGRKLDTAASDTSSWTEGVVTPMRPSRLGRIAKIPNPRHAPRFTGEERWERAVRQLSMPVAAAIAVFALGSGVTAALTGDPMKPLDSVGRVVDHLSGNDETVSYNVLKENINKAKVALENGDEETARQLLATVASNLDEVDGSEATLLKEEIAQVEEEIPATGGSTTVPGQESPSGGEVPSQDPTKAPTNPTTQPSSEPTTEPSKSTEPTQEPSPSATTTPPPTTPDTEPTPLATGVTP